MKRFRVTEPVPIPQLSEAVSEVVSEVFSDADYTMALDKIKAVARSYHGGEAAARGAGGLSGFADAAAMDATLLREQLKQQFNLRFSAMPLPLGFVAPLLTMTIS